MKNWLKILLVLLAVAAISVAGYFILRACGVTSIDGLREIITKCGAWGWIVFIALFVACSTLMCFMPGTSATFIAVAIVLFGALNAFIICTISVFLASSLMFLLGNTVGEKAAIKLVGKESLDKAQNLLDMKSKMLLPLMFMFPVFPDDALCMVAGMTKMKYWYFAIVALVFRTIGIATICFLGSGFIDWSTLSLIDWFVLINVVVFDIFLIFKYQGKLEKFILKRRSKGKTEEVETKQKKELSSEAERLDNLYQKREQLLKAILRNQSIISNKKYCNAEQLANIKKKIKREQEEKFAVENTIKELEAKLNVGTMDAKTADRQGSYRKKIEEFMQKFYPTLKYELKCSYTTLSIYLSFISQHNVVKTIRFSDHATKKGISTYPLEVINKNNAMKSVVERNLKLLEKKNVYVLLEKIQKGEV